MKLCCRSVEVFESETQQASDATVTKQQFIAFADFDRQIVQGGESHEFFAIGVGDFLGDDELGNSTRVDGFTTGVNAHHGETLAADLFVESLNRASAFFLLSANESFDRLI
jgi:hypothetical protein